jgi:hypothetical protein
MGLGLVFKRYANLTPLHGILKILGGPFHSFLKVVEDSLGAFLEVFLNGIGGGVGVVREADGILTGHFDANNGKGVSPAYCSFSFAFGSEKIIGRFF